jgi:hypothetical protein
MDIAAIADRLANDDDLLARVIWTVKNYDSERAASQSFEARLEHLGIQQVSDTRKESLKIAADLGADDEVLKVLAEATRVRRKDTILLPAKYAHTSRGKAWCRKGRGDSAEWGEREGNAFEVGPGAWTVFSSDGFRREKRVEWEVEHVQVGDQTWTVAD